jgi:ribosomal protein L32
MRRTSRIYLNKTVNKSKLDNLKSFLILYQLVVNYCIVRFWATHDTSKDLPDAEVIKSILERFGITARLAQAAGKQAKEIVCSQNEKSKRKRRMPRLTSHTANLDSRFVNIEPFNGHFEMCLKFGSGVPNLVIPFNWTKHTNKFRDTGWELANSIRLGYNKKGLFIDLIFEKERPKVREQGIIIGVDNGFNTMLVTSDGQFIGEELKAEIKRGGRRRKSWHHYIETEANRCLKQLNLDNIKLISLEKRLKQVCEEKGIRISLKNPWKTSQRCSVCGNMDRRNRRGDRFVCLSCGYATNADYNASKNLEALGLAGVYSLRSLQTLSTMEDFSIR